MSLSKKQLDTFLATYENELRDNAWDDLFDHLALNIKASAHSFNYFDPYYIKHLVYTLLISNIDFLSYMSKIPAELFRDNNFITSVNIPSTVRRIGHGAFRNCNLLESVNIPASVTSIGNKTFRSCARLKSITIPSSIKIIKRETFSFCSKLESVTIPSSVIEIEGFAFYKCDSLPSVQLLSTSVKLGSHAFDRGSGGGAKNSIPVFYPHNVPASVTVTPKWIGKGRFML